MDLKEAINRVVKSKKIPRKHRPDLEREAARAVGLGYEVEAWLYYWWEKEKNRVRQEKIIFVDPHILDNRLLGGVDDERGDDMGRHRDSYHGWIPDDV
jgi:hypothetical protein